MIKLIITDVDDTITREGGSTINPEYYDIIRECKRRGIIFGVASGRQKPCVKRMFESVLEDIFILADNGTDIWAKDYSTYTAIPDDYYHELARQIREFSPVYTIMACKPDIAYIEVGHDEMYNHMLAYPFELEYVDDASRLNGICKVSCWRKPFVEQEIIELMRDRWQDKLEVCMGGEMFLDFMDRGCNKGRALQIIQEHYGVLPEETVAFGNAGNDIPMLLRAKHSYAVSGSSPDLKEAASEVIGSMEEDAVLAKMKELLELL